MQHQQGAAAIGRVVRNAETCALLQVFQVLDLFGIHTNREVDGVADRHDLVATVLDLLVEVGLVLVAVGVQVAGGQCRVGLHIVAELDDLDFQAVFFSDLFDLLENLRVRACRDANSQRLVLRQQSAGEGGCEGQREGRLHEATFVHGVSFF